MSPFSLGILGSARVAPTGSAYAAAVLADSPALYWRLNETGGTSAADDSGNNRTGTYSGTLSFSQAAAGTALGTSVDFAGGAQVTRTYESWMNVDSFTLEAWVYPTAAADASADTVIAMRGGAGDRWQFRRESNGAWTLVSWSAAGAALVRTIALSTQLPINNWGHFVIAKNGANVTTFFNGSQISSESVNDSLFAASNQSITVGSIFGSLSEPFPGRIDEVAFYPTVLTLARAQAHYNARNA